MKLKSVATLALTVAAAASQAQVLNPANGHYYSYVQQSMSWDQAVAAAAAMSHNGMQGYLVTVTSDQESDFIYSNITSSTVWAGGTDRGTEGSWRWATGPEAGTVFWQNGNTLTYARWSGGEPNNCNCDGSGGEHILHINWAGSAWNDIYETPYGFVVEFSGGTPPIPEPSTYALMALGLGAMGLVARRRRAR